MKGKQKETGKKVRHNTGAGQDSDTEREYNSHEQEKKALILSK